VYKALEKLPNIKLFKNDPFLKQTNNITNHLTITTCNLQNV
jgi:hypothetical protein